MTVKPFVAGLLMLLVLTSCTVLDTGMPTTSPHTVPPTPQSPVPVLEPSPELPTTPEYLPCPTADMFGLDGLDASLFDATIDALDAYYVASGMYELVIPRIGILGLYDAAEDEVGVICWVESFCYSRYLQDKTKADFGIFSNPVCIVVKRTGDSEYRWVSYKEVESGQSDLPGGGYFGSITEMCEPIDGLAEKIIEYSFEPEYMMPGQRELLKMYCTATAANIVVSDWNGFGD